MTVTFAPNHVLRPTVIGFAISQPPSRISWSFTGWPTVMSEQFGPIMTRSPSVTFACARMVAPKLMNTPLPHTRLRPYSRLSGACMPGTSDSSGRISRRISCARSWSVLPSSLNCLTSLKVRACSALASGSVPGRCHWPLVWRSHVPNCCKSMRTFYGCGRERYYAKRCVLLSSRIL